MGLARLLKIAFEEGCGLPMRDVAKSAQLRELVKLERSIYDRYPEDARDSHLLRIGHFSLARLAQEIFDGVKQEEQMRPTDAVIYSPGVLIERAWIRYLGHHLVKSSEACLPDKAIELAQAWQGASLYQRDDLLHQLYSLIRELHHSRWSSDESADEGPYDWIRYITESYDYRDVLPFQYGKFGSSERYPLCLGLATIMVAWARLAGAKVMLVNSLLDPYDLMWQSEGEVSRLLLDDIEERGLRVSPRAVAGFRHNIDWARAREHHAIDFHHAVVIQIEGGAWQLLDPYLGCYGLLSPDSWDAFSVNHFLSEFSDIAPGLTVVRHDGGYLEGWYRERETEVGEAIAASRRLDEQLRSIPVDRSEIEACLNQSQEARLLVDLARFPNRLKKIKQPSEIAGAIMFQLGPRSLSKARLDRGWEHFLGSERYRRNSLNRLSGAFHTGVKKQYYRLHSEMRSTGMVPAALEFGNPEFQVALLVLNHLRCWGPESGMPGELLMKHSSSQVF